MNTELSSSISYNRLYLLYSLLGISCVNSYRNIGREYDINPFVRKEYDVLLKLTDR